MVSSVDSTALYSAQADEAQVHARGHTQDVGNKTIYARLTSTICPPPSPLPLVYSCSECRPVSFVCQVNHTR